MKRGSATADDSRASMVITVATDAPGRASATASRRNGTAASGSPAAFHGTGRSTATWGSIARAVAACSRRAGGGDAGGAVGRAGG